MSRPMLSPATAPPTPDRALRRLFLTLFLRGRSARGLQQSRVPKSVGSKLLLTLLVYAGVGLLVGYTFRRLPVFSYALYLHSMTLVFLGMAIASSAGEVLFNKEEADILLHRPVTSHELLRAKISVLVQVSLWLAAAFNLAGFIIGPGVPGGSWAFPAAHLISVTLEALFCTGCVVLAYELCLRWFGRERLEGLMTTVQVVVAVGTVLGGQVVPQLIAHTGTKVSFRQAWWTGLLPPAWFAGFDDALAGSGARESWILGALGVSAVALILWLAFSKLAHHYSEGWQALGENAATQVRSAVGGRRWLERFVQAPPLRWWLRDPVTRASFFLTAGYLLRDRETKLRIYPGLAPMLVMPVIFLLQDRGRDGFAAGFGVAFTGGYLGLVALLGLNFLQYSQQWLAADVFRLAPIAGPARICAGARRAVLCFLVLPTLAGFGLLGWCLRESSAHLPLLLPGIMALPLFALYPHLGGRAIPFSSPGEEAKSADRGLQTIGVMMVSMTLSLAAVWAWSSGWFWWLILGESLAVGTLAALMAASLARVPWASPE